MMIKKAGFQLLLLYYWWLIKINQKNLFEKASSLTIY